MFLRKATWTPLDYKATSSHHLEMTHEAQPSPHKTAQPLSLACLPSGPSLTVMSTLPPQGPGARARTIFPGDASIFDPGHGNLWRPLYPRPPSGDPSNSSGYLHPAQLLETGLSCLPYPTLFLLRSRLALSLPFSFIITPSMEKLLAAGQRQGCPQRRFPSWNISPLLRCSSTWTSPHRFRDK